MKKLYRSNIDKKIAGVCGGFAEYLNTDPTVLRLIFACSILFGGFGIMAYIICWLLIPQNPDPAK